MPRANAVCNRLSPFFARARPPISGQSILQVGCSDVVFSRTRPSVTSYHSLSANPTKADFRENSEGSRHYASEYGPAPHAEYGKSVLMQVASSALNTSS